MTTEFSTAQGREPEIEQPASPALRHILIVAAVVIGLGLLPFISGLLGALMIHVVVRPIFLSLRRWLPRRVETSRTTSA
jgi:hypothetical protein